MARQYTIKRHEGVLYKINYQQELDKGQLEVVTADGGPMLVIAGAGSGKTRTVTYRVARLIESGIAPDRIMLVTFTNKASREMLQRVDQIVKTDTRRIWGGTFHSIANRILRRNAESLGYGPRFTILDTEDAKDMIEAAIDEAKIDIKAKRFPQANLLQDVITLSVNKDLSIREVISQEFSSLIPVVADIERVADLYAQRKKTSNAMDYDDLLLNWKKALSDFPEIHQAWSTHFQHILVDEYQDTNKIQSDIVDLLASTNRNVMVVGDDAQAIYGFRGANFENIYKFQERYPDAKVYNLQNNYRSRPEILAVANESIKNNQKQFPKNLLAMRLPCGEKPGLVPLASADEQSAFVASRILETNAQGVSLAEMAILYRSHWQSLEMQLELTRRNIPYSVRSGMRFFEQAHIKDVIAHLRIVINPKDETAWKRILRLLPGIGKSTALKIWDRVAASADPLEMIAKEEFSAKPKAVNSWNAFVKMIQQVAAAESIAQPGSQIELVLASGYRDYLMNTFPNANSRIEDLEQLAGYAARFEGTEQFLSELFLISNERYGGAEGIAGEDAMDSDDEDDHVVLSSIHQAKGLEWKAVFIVWTAEGKFPSSRTLKDADALEEERRLFYVAVTRAKDELYLSYPMIDNDYTRLTVVQRPSRFITEVSNDLFETWSVE